MKLNILSFVPLADQRDMEEDLTTDGFCVVQLKVYRDNAQPIEAIRVPPSKHFVNAEYEALKSKPSIGERIFSFIRGGKGEA